MQHEFERSARLNDLQEVILTARSGNRKAFDYLREQSSFPHPYYEIAESTAREIMRELANRPVRASPLLRMTPEEVTKILKSSSNPAERMTAIESFYPPDDPAIVPALIDTIYNDDNLQVVLVALRSFNARAHSGFRYGEYYQVKDWWDGSKDAILRIWKEKHSQM